MNILVQEEVWKQGKEFMGDICYSGIYGQQVYTKNMEDGGVPFEGILYQNYKSGKINYYAYYKNGIPNGIRVRFYESGKIESICYMDTGTIDGKLEQWYENGNIKLIKWCKYGLVLKSTEWDEKGNIISEKKQLSESEKELYEKYIKFYEKNNS